MENTIYKKISFKNYLNNKFLILIFLSLFSFLLLSSFLKVNTNKSLRLLADIREEGPNEICMEINNNDLYDLFPLQEIETKVINPNINLKFCQNINNTIKSSVIYTGEKGIIRLSGDIHGEQNNKNKIILEDSNNESNKKIKIYLAYGDKIENKDSRYKVNIELNCNNNIEFNCTSISDFDSNLEELNIIAESKYACGKKDKYNSFLEKNYFWIGVILIVAGGFLGILGYKQKEICIYLVCLAGGFYLYKILDDLFNLYNEYFILCIAIIVVLFILSIVIAIIVYKNKSLFKYYMLLIGGLLGYSIGLLINSTIILIINTSKQKLIQFSIYVLLIIAGIIIGRFQPKVTYIIGTSIIGSYGLMRGISLYLGRAVPYLNEQKIYDLAHSGNFEKIGEIFSGWFYIYPAMLLFFTIICNILQYYINPKIDDITNYKELESQYDDTKLVKDFRFRNDSEETD